MLPGDIRNNRTGTAVSAAIFCAFYFCGNAIAGASWTPASTRVLIVGVLKWKSSELSGFLLKNRRDRKLATFFKNEGVPKGQVIYLDNQAATLQKVMSSLKQQCTSSGANDTLIFYYCGHGWLDENSRGYLANYDAGESNDSCLSVTQIAKEITQEFKGKQVLVFADCCCSGSLAKAMRACSPPFNWCVITSANAEISSTQNWTFSQSLLDTLSGHAFADADHDGQVTLAELGKYVKNEMKQLENQDATADSTKGFDKKFVLAEVQFPDEIPPENVEVMYQGGWWKAKLIGVKNGRAKVHWLEIGWDSASDDTIVPLSTVRRLPSNISKPAAWLADYNRTRPPIEIGKKVQVLYEGEFYPGKILDARENEFQVHYDNYDSRYDEWVDKSRILY